MDAIQFGDDFSTQTDLMMSLTTWRRFFKPRYEVLMKPIREAGKKIFFHTCGCGMKLLPELADLKVHAIWPQLDVYDHGELSRRCREARIAVALHPNRWDLMVRSTPHKVAAAVLRITEDFSVADGARGSTLRSTVAFRSSIRSRW